MLRLTLFLLSIIVVFHSNAATSKEVQSAALNAALEKYRSGNQVEADLEKKITSTFLDKISVYKGKIFISKDLVRVEIDEPEKSWIIFDGKILWNVQFPSADFGGDLLVTKAKVSSKNKNQLLLNTLFNKNDFSKNFKIAKVYDKGPEQEILDLITKAKDMPLKDVSLVINKKFREIQSISYSDDVGNNTEISLSKITLKSDRNKKLFQYTPPKKAKVTEI